MNFGEEAIRQVIISFVRAILTWRAIFLWILPNYLTTFGKLMQNKSKEWFHYKALGFYSKIYYYVRWDYYEIPSMSNSQQKCLRNSLSCFLFPFIPIHQSNTIQSSVSSLQTKHLLIKNFPNYCFTFISIIVNKIQTYADPQKR